MSPWAFPPAPYSAKGCVSDEILLRQVLNKYRDAVLEYNRAKASTPAAEAFVRKMEAIRSQVEARAVEVKAKQTTSDFEEGLTDEINGEKMALSASTNAQYKAGTALMDRGYRETSAAYRADAVIYCPDT